MFIANTQDSNNVKTLCEEFDVYNTYDNFSNNYNYSELLLIQI